MHRTSTDAEYLDSGKVVIDADGVPFEPAAKSDLAVKADKSYVDTELGGKANSSHTHNYSQISGRTTEVTADPNDAYKVLYTNYMGRFRVRTDSIIHGSDVANREFALQQNWHKGIVPAATASLSDLQDGAWGVASAAVSQTLGIPNNALGTLQVVTISNGRTAFYVTNDQRMFITSRSGGVWADWTQVGGATTEGVTQQELDVALATKSDSGHTHDASEITGLGIKPPAHASPTALKSVPLALTLGQGGTSGAPNNGHYRIPIRYNAPILRWRLAIRSANPYYNSPGSADLTIKTITIGEHAGQGAFTQAPNIVAEGLNLPPGDRNVTYTEWQDVPLGDDREMLLGLTYESNNDTAPPLLVGGSWKFDATTPATDVAPAGGVQSIGTPLDIWIEAETLGGTPVVAVVGDSTSCGVGATIPVYDSWLSVYCRQNGALPVHYANSGHTALDWNKYPSHSRITRWNNLPQPDAVIFALGNNDMGSDTPPMSERAMESYRIIRERIGDNVYAASVKPRASVTPEQQQRRQDYINWLSGPGKELFRDTFDVNTPLGGDSLLPEYDSGDGAHLNSAGYEVYADAVGRVVAPPLAYQQGEQYGL